MNGTLKETKDEAIAKELTTLDLFDIHYKADCLVSRYQELEQMLEQLSQALSNNVDQKEIKELIEKIGHTHSECSANLKAIKRLAK